MWITEANVAPSVIQAPSITSFCFNLKFIRGSQRKLTFTTTTKLHKIWLVCKFAKTKSMRSFNSFTSIYLRQHVVYSKQLPAVTVAVAVGARAKSCTTRPFILIPSVPINLSYMIILNIVVIEMVILLLLFLSALSGRQFLLTSKRWMKATLR